MAQYKTFFPLLRTSKLAAMHQPFYEDLHQLFQEQQKLFWSQIISTESNSCLKYVSQCCLFISIVQPLIAFALNLTVISFYVFPYLASKSFKI